MKQRKIIFSLLILIVCFMQTACMNSNNVSGQWSNIDRDLILKEKQFEIVFHNTTQIIAFNGTYTTNRNEIKLIFMNFKDQTNTWHTLKDTELENHQETMKYKITNNHLKTYMVTTKKTYSYTRK